ncbi:MAG: hypothetical protein ACTSVV_18065 [Promethearchaeota archaeon]
MNIEYYNNEEIKKILIQCPICKKKEKIEIPTQIVLKSKQLSTISIPKNFICEHCFQVFLDKNFKVRGYQKVDYELSLMEFYDYEDEINDLLINKANKKEDSLGISFRQKFLKILREYVDNKKIIGCGLFSINGDVLYSSIPLKILTHTLREFEIRKKKNFIMVKKLFLILQDNKKLFSHFIEISNFSFIITLYFSENIRTGLCDYYLNTIVKEIENLIKNLNND